MEIIALPAPLSPAGRATTEPTSPATVQRIWRQCKRQGSDGPVSTVSKSTAGPRKKSKARPIAFNQHKLNPVVKETAAFGGKHLGGVDAACCQLLFGFEVSALNHAKLFNTDCAKVATNLINRIVYEDDEHGHISKTKRSSPRLPGTGFERQLELLFRYVLKHSTKAVWSFADERPDEPWIAGFCAAVVNSEDLRDADRTIAMTINNVAYTCLQSLDQQKMAEVERKSELTLKRKAAHMAEAGKRHGFGAYPVPKAGSTVATDAGFRFDDFDEDGELLPDSDCEDEDSEWNRKKARYCKLMAQKREGMDLKGRGTWTPQPPGSDGPLVGLPLIVYYDEDGSDCNKNVPYAAKVVEEWYDSHNTPALLVRFDNGEQAHITDEDEWRWV